jgi:tetratricopeptide (TPR) repeat protein
MERGVGVPRLALCMIVRDEEQMLPGCLESVRGVVDEMVVVDTGSTDNTVAIARAAGATVVPFAWCDDFAAARNAGLPHVTADWILVLDADERLAADAGERIHRAIHRGGFHLAQLPLYDSNRQDATPEEVLSGAARDGEPVLLSRLFRRVPELRWFGIVHESVSRWGEEDPRTLAQLGAPIVHYGYSKGYREARGKAERNIRLLRRSRDAFPDDARIRMYLASELRGVRRFAEARAEIDVAWALVRRAWAAGRRPLVVSVLTVRTVLLQAEGRVDEALGMLDEAVAHDVVHPNMDFLRGWLLRRRDPAVAETSFERAVAAAGQHLGEPVYPGATGEVARQGLAGIARDRGDWARVRAVLAPHASVPATSTSLLLAEAMLAEDPAAARAMLDALPGSGDRDVLRAACAEALADPHAMEEAMAACREGMPFDDDGRMARWTYLDLIRRGGAVWDSITAPVGPAPDAATAASCARRSLAAGAFRESIGWTRALLRHHPRDVQGWANLSLAAQLAGNAALAVSVADAAVRASPEAVELRAVRLLMAEMVGDRVLAARLARSLLAATGGHPDAEAALTRLGVHRTALSHEHVSASVVVVGSADPMAWTSLLDSLALQDGVSPAVEVVLVDPPEPDRLVGAPRPYRLRVVRPESPHAAWDDGWRASLGPSVVFLGPDAVPAPGALRTLLSASAGRDVVQGVSRRHASTVDDTATVVLVDGDPLPRPDGDGRRMLTPFALAVPREVLVRVGGLARDLAHPWAVGIDLAARLASAGVAVSERADVVFERAPSWTVDDYLSAQQHFAGELYTVWSRHGASVEPLVQRALGSLPHAPQVRSALENGAATESDLEERMYELRHALGRVLPGRAEARGALLRALQGAVRWYRWRGVVKAAHVAGVVRDT